MSVLDILAEQRIKEALERGDLEGLPGAGRPLELDDDALVPEELRLANRILKNAGYTPADLPRGHNKLALPQLRLEGRYFGKVVRKLSR